MMIDICLLGCGGSMPISSRFLSAVLIRYNGKMCLIDCGENTQVALKLLGWGLKHIDVICLTHYHGDHLFGLPGLLSTISNSERTEPVTIIGPKGLSSIITGIRSILPYLPYELKLCENPSSLEFNNMTISTLSLNHTSPCLGYGFEIKRSPRFDVLKAESNNVPKKIWNLLQKGGSVNIDGVLYTPEMILGQERRGIKLSIITDTRPIPTIPEFIKDSNLFICEGMYGDDADIEKAQNNKHMTFREAALLAKAGNVSEMILTHFSPSMADPALYLNNALEVFPNTHLGTDGLVRMLKFGGKEIEK